MYALFETVRIEKKENITMLTDLSVWISHSKKMFCTIELVKKKLFKFFYRNESDACLKYLECLDA